MDWNARYLEGDTPWEKGEAAPPLREISARLGKVIWGLGPVLVPGCGFGHDARWIAEQGAEVVGLDVSELALAEARERTLGGSPSFELGDFFEAQAGRFLSVFEHTCFCAIDPSERENYVAAVSQWLPADGHLVAIFFLNPGSETGPPFGTSLEELDELFGENFDLVDEWEPQVSYPGREGREWIRILKRK